MKLAALVLVLPALAACPARAPSRAPLVEKPAPPVALADRDLSGCQDGGTANGDFVVSGRQGSASLYDCRDRDIAEAIVSIDDNGDSTRDLVDKWGPGAQVWWAIQGSVEDTDGPDALIVWTSIDDSYGHREAMKLLSYAGGKQAVLWSAEGAYVKLDGSSDRDVLAVDVDAAVDSVVTQTLHAGTLTPTAE